MNKPIVIDPADFRDVTIRVHNADLEVLADMYEPSPHANPDGLVNTPSKVAHYADGIRWTVAKPSPSQVCDSIIARVFLAAQGDDQ